MGQIPQNETDANSSYSWPNSTTQYELMVGQLSGTWPNLSLNWGGDPLTFPLTQRRQHVANWSNGRLYVFGGLSALNNVHLYTGGPTNPLEPGGTPNAFHDPATDLWYYVPD